jgi:SpoVK/Ycf46/Vps4 family AAA+-type ATPase
MMRQDLDTYIRARYPLLYVVTAEEERALEQIEALAVKQRKKVVAWSCTEGCYNTATPTRRDASKRDPLLMLNVVVDEPAEAATIYVLRDFHPYFQSPEVVRRLRDVAQAVKRSSKTVVLLSPVLKIPPELEKEITLVDFDLPAANELAAMLDQIVDKAQSTGALSVQLDKREREQLVRATLGLTEIEAENAVAKATVLTGALDRRAIDLVSAEKRQIIRKSGLLEFYDLQARMDDVGGLDVLKEWLRKRARAFGEEARAFGLPSPKGILLVGVQGCGKSLVAKSIANGWKLPLLRLDVGRLFGGLVGSSEENLRKAIQLAESVAPVVLWTDEIEKGFSGVGSSNFSDAGTAARVFGSFITWLQEKIAPVFVVATANDVSQLPPELVRKGRFDEVFFVDLPTPRERQEIFRIHLGKRKRDPSQFNLATLAMASEGLSGAEIEQALVAALYEAFDQARPMVTEDLLGVLQETVPVSQMMSESIDALRQWAKQRARAASSAMIE